VWPTARCPGDLSKTSTSHESFVASSAYISHRYGALWPVVTDAVPYPTSGSLHIFDQDKLRGQQFHSNSPKRVLRPGCMHDARQRTVRAETRQEETLVTVPPGLQQRDSICWRRNAVLVCRYICCLCLCNVTSLRPHPSKSRRISGAAARLTTGGWTHVPAAAAAALDPVRAVSWQDHLRASCAWLLVGSMGLLLLAGAALGLWCVLCSALGAITLGAHCWCHLQSGQRRWPHVSIPSCSSWWREPEFHMLASGTHCTISTACDVLHMLQTHNDLDTAAPQALSSKSIQQNLRLQHAYGNSQGTATASTRLSRVLGGCGRL
jgi:hypothetical protein